MDDNAEKISHLLEKLDLLKKRQDFFQKEISGLYSEIVKLQAPLNEEVVPDEKPTVKAENNLLQHQAVQEPAVKSQQETRREIDTPPYGTPGKQKFKTDIEKFIGENLINKIGIAVTVIGVGIGAKYAIDHQLISPWTRIILGYLVGLGLLGFAIRLKKQYEHFSGVLFSGSMAIMYFITYAAYTFYDLFPVTLTFILMVLFTFFTVAAATKFNLQVIAHIGLVGAYAVPFLLGSKSGQVLILFSYMTLINAGILVIAFRKYWKLLYYSSFLLSWLIFLTWYIPDYKVSEHFALALIFLSVFFVTFYLMLLVNNLVRKEKYKIDDILLLLANSGIFYGLGYATIHSNISTEGLTGLFTLCNAIIQFAVAALIRVQKPSDRGLLSYVTGLGLVFISIAIPVQFDGIWVTLLWCGEAAALFWTGRTKGLTVYELLSYPMMFVAFFSLMHDWSMVYNVYDTRFPETRIVPIFNINFLTSLFFLCSLGFIQYLNGLPKYTSPLEKQKPLLNTMNFSIPAILLFVLYFAFFKELTNFWNQLYADSLVTRNNELTVMQHFRNENLLRYSTISVFNYSLLFFTLLSFLNIRWLKSIMLGLFNLGLNTIILGVFLTVGLYTIGELREGYLSQSLSEFYYRGSMDIGIRYVSFVFVVLMLISIHRYLKTDFIQVDLKMEFDFLLHITILTLLGNELINWMDLSASGQSYKLGLSILFGVYALFLVGLGIWKKKTHLRIAAISLFALTLIKVFLYDLTSLDTISKTIVFVSLGVLLLIISFLYTKYKALIFPDREEKPGKPL